MSATLDPAHSVTLLASAGTGKTWALTARIVRLLLAGAEPGSILALTFTRKAAGEMQSRVAARLQALAYASEAELGRLLREIGADDDAATRQRARGLFEAALYADTPLRASTLHVFCAEVLGRFALEAEVPAGFTLVENERALRGEAIEAVLRQAHRDPQSPAAQALDSLADEGLSEFEVRGLLRSLFEHRAELWAATEGEAEPLASLCAALAAALPWDSAAAPCEQLDAPGFSFRLKAFYGLLRDSQDSQYVKHAALEPALAASGDERLRALLAALYKKDRSGPYALKLSKRFSDAQAEAVRHHHAALLEALVLVADQQRSAATYRRSRAALTLGLAVLEAFALGLQRSHQLGFAELEWQTVRLLRRAGSAEWVRYKLDRQLEHVLLDEFQDTSPTQWRLLLPLLEEFVSRRDSARTVFLVGDGKQSIYGFRRAEPALLGIAGDWLAAALAAKSESLHESRRSAPAVIDFVNALFGGDAGEQIGFAPHRTALGELCGQVEVAPLIQPAEKSTAANDAALRNPLTTPREVDEDRRAAEEAQWVVDRIRQLMDQRLVITARDGEHRALRWDDVMVLARHRTHLGILEKTLGIEGIPYSSATRSTLLATPVAQDLLALLGVLDSPHRDLALAQALRSPLFSVSDDALLWLADAARASGQSWFAALGNADAPDVLADAGERLREWRTLAQTLPPHDLIDRIASESDLLRRSRAARPHDTLLAGNLSALLQLALDTDHGRYPTLGGFLRHCQQLGDGDGPDEAPPAAGEARLRVMTVHAAKGLEAAVVFLVNSAPTPRPAQAGWRVDWPAAAERPVVVVHAGKVEQREPLSRTLLEAAQRREQREDLNLLYVAVTRARQYLFVSGFQSGRAVQAESWHARCRAALASLSPVTTTSPTALWSHASGALPLLGAATPESGSATPLNPRLLMPLPRADAAGVDHRARDPEAVLHGQTVHAVLQHLASDAALSDEALLARVQQQMGLRPAAALWAHALAEARQVRAAPALSRFFDGHGQSWNEVPLHVETATGIEISVLDRLVDTGEALWVIDYKTSRRPPAEVLAAAEAQLRRYVAAVQRLFPARAVRAAVISTSTATLLTLT